MFWLATFNRLSGPSLCFFFLRGTDELEAQGEFETSPRAISDVRI